MLVQVFLNCVLLHQLSLYNKIISQKKHGLDLSATFPQHTCDSHTRSVCLLQVVTSQRLIKEGGNKIYAFRPMRSLEYSVLIGFSSEAEEEFLKLRLPKTDLREYRFL